MPRERRVKFSRVSSTEDDDDRGIEFTTPRRPHTDDLGFVSVLPPPPWRREPYNRYAADNDAMEEMDSMFRAPDERTDFTSLVTEEAEVKPSKRYSEDDFQGHFRENQYAKPHEPLKPAKQKKKKHEGGGSRRASIRDEDDDEEEDDAAAKSSSRTVPTLLVTDETAQGSDEAKKGDDKSSKHHHKHHRQHVEDPAGRRVPGSERRPRRPSTGQGPLDDELQDASDPHQDDISNHRFEEAGRRHHHKVAKKKDEVVRLGDINAGHGVTSGGKKIFDHTPHDIYVQMDELTATDSEAEWQACARWIKYEEDVEPGSDRWGKPHLSSLSFQSLMHLRRCLEKGVVLLDVEEHDSVAISHRITTQLVNEDAIQQQDFGAVMRTLLLRRQHVADHNSRGLRNYMSSRNLSRATLQSLADMRRDSARSLSEVDKDKLKNSLTVMSSSHGQIPRHNSFKSAQEIGGESVASNDDLRRFMSHNNILRRLAPGTETFSVNVGRVDFAAGPVAAFVRLSEGTYLPGITEMPLPVRFIFFLVGPHDSSEDYNETGRAFATIMSTPAFHEAAYKAESRSDLMWAFKEFLDDTLVLPPIDWTANPDVLDVHMLQTHSREIQERKREKLALRSRRESMVPGATVGPNGVAADGADAPPGDGDKKPEDDDPLTRRGRPFAGFINDIKRRYPHYVSDFKDGLDAAVFSAAFFIYFAALAGAITFGGLMMDKTDLLVGISETLISTAMAGVIFSLFSCQPLIIVGTTGPVLLFDEALYSFANSNGLEFLPMRVWIAIWMLAISLVLVGLEGSVLVRKFTRFTTEIFSSLVSLLFIFESLAKLASVFIEHPLLADYCTDSLFLSTLPLVVNPLSGEHMNVSTAMVAAANGNDTISANETELIDASNPNATMLGDAPLTDPKNQPNTALLSLLLMFGTFAIAQYLRYFRNSKFLGRRVRRMLGDFGVPIAILIMVGVDMLIPMVYTQRLEVPAGLTPSNPAVRDWLISPLGVHQSTSWLAIVGAIPAAGLIFIVIYMETMVCELIMAKPERNLKKGTGFHVDIVVMSVINLISALIGAPWMCAATIRSVSHAAALTVMSTTYAPGEKPKMVGVHEQRLSNLLVSIMMGLSVALSSVLKLIPVAVVFGVFMYMGVSSMTGVQMMERVVLFLKPVKYHPDENYVKRVKTWRMHLFTIIQFCCLGFLLGIKFTPAAIGFPFFLAMLVPLRLVLLPRLFSPIELQALDGDGGEMADDTDADFYEEAHTVPAATSAPSFYNNSSLQLLRVQSALSPQAKV
ncbi:band 3 anion exchange protein-like isoform X3 [Amphibalanus amphitrite]|uniref:band 3 anion exchange protein-like isoform X3 n=1 Tax=Amphibalanus amphitrite TaxID=1232801 RepID=UPI001C9187DB|nr:band 3 anion exchange protein-like isoform X3 [Amphibalanus amphitrite]XP_043216385.1 band 3 anion exchange protein-like isoform X3 [Amphibalanus amphitrite]XP_043216386.1 band 3 anion exchange protein-like isoform X3 [Amphibalanus amphitrite]XP_043216387.1 band 3 anion exchange protein-like isoform X3 [Amphibalanus amphitrite]